MEPTPLIEGELIALVSLCLAYSTRGRLAAALLELKSAIAVSRLDGWGDKPPEHAVHRALHILRLKGIRTIPVWQWPERLLRAKPLAPALFVRGDAALLWRKGIAVIGAREAHHEARTWAANVARDHAARGELVISGGARGIDSAAHNAAIAAGGKTIAYIGAPADAIYPRHNGPLFNTMVTQGHAVVSELLPGDFTGRAAHANRNRFIAAHASHLFIAEADIVSGSLSAAAFASDYETPIGISPQHVGIRRSGLELLLAERRATVVETKKGTT